LRLISAWSQRGRIWIRVRIPRRDSRRVGGVAFEWRSL